MVIARRVSTFFIRQHRPLSYHSIAPAVVAETFLAEGQGVDIHGRPQQRILASEARGKAILGVI